MRLSTTPLVLVAIAASAACGPTTAELEARDARIEELESERAQLHREVERLNARAEALSQVVEGLATDVDTLEEDRESLQTGLQEAQDALTELSEMWAAMEDELARSESTVSELEQDREALAARLADARRTLQEVRDRERQARERLETMRSMLRQLSALIDSGDLRVRIVRNRMVVELPEAILFDTGRAEVKESGREVLEQLAPVLEGLSERELQVAGHTDDRPIRTRRYPSNWELSTARAVNVTKLLIEHGIAPERLSAAGHADTQPIADNDTDEGRQQNRRIEIVLLPNLDELPDLSSLETLTGER